MLNPKFVQFRTPDGLLLPGLLYHPKLTDRVVIFLHGNGSSSIFYSDDSVKTMGRVLNKNNIALLAFNNRGAHLIKKLNVEKNGNVQRKNFGMAYEKIKDCVYDINGALEFLKKEGFDKFYLAGASTGANKICVYNHHQFRNNIKKYILIAGADDTGYYYQSFGKKKFYELLNLSKKKIKIGKGEEIICELLPDEVLSYQAFYDIANPDGDYNIFPFYEKINHIKLSSKLLFRYYKEIKKPILVIYGENDEYSGGDKTIDILKEHQPNADYRIIKDADHSFYGHIEELDKVIVKWLLEN